MISSLLARWGLQWIMGPVGKALLLAAAALVAIHLIRQDALADCEADQLREELALKDAQLEAQARIIAAARTRADETAQRVAELEDLTNDILLETSGTCPITDDLRERLRAIR